jgi:hypothetical protein
MQAEYFVFIDSSNHSIISISQFEFFPEKFFVCVNSYLPWNYFNVSIFRWSLCHFYEIIVYCYVFSAIYFFRQKIREQYSEHIWVFHCRYSIRKKTGLSFLHFRLRWCSLTWRRSYFAILGENSWKRSTYRLKFEHGRNYVSVLETVWYDSPICRQGKKCKKLGDFPTEVSDMARNMKIELLTFSLFCISRKTVDTYYPYYSWCMTSTDILKWRKTNDCENFEKGMIYMKILKKGR